QCETTFLKQMQKTATHAQFACHVRGINLKHPFITSVELGNMDKQPQMLPEIHQIIWDNWKRRIKGETQKAPEGASAETSGQGLPIITHKPPQSEGKGVPEAKPSFDRPIIPRKDESRGDKWTPPK